MSKYGQTAVMAAEMAQHGTEPPVAWDDAAARVFPGSKSSREKGCPRCAFLGLASAGLINGVAAGRYTESKDHQRYAVEAVEHLQQHPQLARQPTVLWTAITNGISKRHNAQMDVVTALWNAGKIASPVASSRISASEGR